MVSSMLDPFSKRNCFFWGTKILVLSAARKLTNTFSRPNVSGSVIEKSGAFLRINRNLYGNEAWNVKSPKGGDFQGVRLWIIFTSQKLQTLKVLGREVAKLSEGCFLHHRIDWELQLRVAGIWLLRFNLGEEVTTNTFCSNNSYFLSSLRISRCMVHYSNTQLLPKNLTTVTTNQPIDSCFFNHMTHQHYMNPTTRIFLARLAQSTWNYHKINIKLPPKDPPPKISIFMKIISTKNITQLSDPRSNLPFQTFYPPRCGR